MTSAHQNDARDLIYLVNIVSRPVNCCALCFLTILFYHNVFLYILFNYKFKIKNFNLIKFESQLKFDQISLIETAHVYNNLHVISS